MNHISEHPTKENITIDDSDDSIPWELIPPDHWADGIKEKVTYE